MNVACVMAAQYDDIIYMNIWYEQRPQRALFNCSLSYIVRKYLRIEKISLQGFTEASSVFTEMYGKWVGQQYSMLIMRKLNQT